MRFQLVMLCVLGLSISSAQATTLFFNNDLPGFTAVTTTTLTDFEGIVADNTNKILVNPFKSGEPNTYLNAAGSGGLLICGKNGCNGQPYDSALLLAVGDAGNPANIRIELGAGASAVGGIFGDADGPAGSGTLRVYTGSGDLFDTRSVAYGDMGEGLPKTFFGWASDEVLFTALDFAIFGGADFSAVDDFRVGSAESPLPPVPLPAGVWLFLTALAGLAALGRLKRA